jgi:hypothetical protein
MPDLREPAAAGRRRGVLRESTDEGGTVSKNRSRCVSLLAIAGCGLSGFAATASAGSARSTLHREKAEAAHITTAQANRMQAAAVARGEANSALSNPYIEQKVTTPESTGDNATHIPAGGF